MKNRVQLQDITKDNYRECMPLNVTEQQKTHFAPNSKSLAEAYVYYDSAEDAKNLYLDLKFRLTGEVDAGEIIIELHLDTVG